MNPRFVNGLVVGERSWALIKESGVHRIGFGCVFQSFFHLLDRKNLPKLLLIGGIGGIVVEEHMVVLRMLPCKSFSIVHDSIKAVVVGRRDGEFKSIRTIDKAFVVVIDLDLAIANGCCELESAVAILFNGYGQSGFFQESTGSLPGS